MIYLASCNHDEAGRLGWEGKSQAGDQTGSEVSIVPYLTWDPKVWKAVYRAEDPMVAWNIGQAGIQMCRNNNIGYDQSQRLTFYEQLMQTGNIDLISVPCETDCSAGTCACIIVAGYHDFWNNLRTAYWDEYIMKYGKFIKFAGEEYTRHPDLLHVGDILLKDGHVVIVVEAQDPRQHSMTPKYVLKCTKATWVYRDPVAAASNIYMGHPRIGVDNLVDYCDETENFYFVRIINKFAWVPKAAMTRKDPVIAYEKGDTVVFRGGILYGSSYAASKGIKVKEFLGEITNIVNGSHPYYIWSYAYEGWADKESIEKV